MGVRTEASNRVLGAIMDAQQSKIETGQMILKAKQTLAPAEFDKLLDELPFGRRHARHLMQVAVRGSSGARGFVFK